MCVGGCMGIVYLVHCVDTEGPLDEVGPNRILAGDHYRPACFDPVLFQADPRAETERHRRRTLGGWDTIGAMLRHCTAPGFRDFMQDSAGGGWIYNWFCMDHMGFTDNPRGRDMGIHRVFDVYRRLIEQQGRGDAVHWHFHPMSTYGEAHLSATSYLNSPNLREIIGRRLLDRQWFPKANRAGFNDERPDSHWFLEQWIPFDLSNKASTDHDDERNPDMAGNRCADWRGAPSDWSTYHPDHDYLQSPGNCRRKIARCLALLNRFGNLTEAELDAAFRRAADGLPTLVSFNSHDWRDLVPEIEFVRYLLARVAPRYPGVRFRFAEAVDAFNAVHPPAGHKPLRLECTLLRDARGCRMINITTATGKVFGPQPYLAIRTRSQRIVQDNLNFGRSRSEWTYVFDEQTIRPDDIRTIAVAANDDAGNQSIHVLHVDDAPAGDRVCF